MNKKMTETEENTVAIAVFIVSLIFSYIFFSWMFDDKRQERKEDWQYCQEADLKYHTPEECYKILQDK